MGLPTMRRVAHKMNAQEYLKEHPEILLTDEEIDKNWDSELLSEDLWSDILLHSKTIAKAQYEKAYPKILAEGERQMYNKIVYNLPTSEINPCSILQSIKECRLKKEGK